MGGIALLNLDSTSTDSRGAVALLNLRLNKHNKLHQERTVAGNMPAYADTAIPTWRGHTDT